MANRDDDNTSIPSSAPSKSYPSRSSSNSISPKLSNSDLTFCRLVHSGIPEVQAYMESHNCNDEDYAHRGIPLLLHRGDIQIELARLRNCSPDELLRDDCMRLLASGELRVQDRLKVIQVQDKVLQRLADSSQTEDVTDELRAWISERLQSGPGPMSE